jgi:hypothetical protein
MVGFNWIGEMLVQFVGVPWVLAHAFRGERAGSGQGWHHSPAMSSFR